MSLIYQALRRLGSETEGVPLGSSGTWERRRRSAPALTRSVLFWCLLAAAVSSAATALLIGGGGRAPSSGVASLVERPPPDAVEVTAPGDVAIVEPAETVVSTPVSRVGEAAVRTATSEPVVETRAGAAAPAPAPAPAAAAAEAEAEAEAEVEGAGPAHSMKSRPKVREQVQAESRERARQIADLTARLTRAAETDDRAACDRLLNELESRVGGDSSYLLNMQAYVALVRGEYTEVEALLGVVLARDQLDANAGLNMAVAESRTGRMKQARARLEQLALAHPDDDRIDALLRTM